MPYGTVFSASTAARSAQPFDTLPAAENPACRRRMTTLGVSSGGDPSQWRGAFDCVACGRKRLPAVEFSANAVSKKRADPGRQISCKACTRGAAETERALAAATAKLRVKEGGDGADASAATHECAACKRSRPADAFSNKQLNQKGPGKQRCRECCDAADAADASSAKTLAEVRLTRAREASANAEKTNAPDKLAVFAREAALEAELVTGLKPKRIGGRGRGGRGAFGRGGANRNGALGRGGR